jgi:hypothetical protein
MLDALAQALHDSSLSQTLRASIWLYPVVNTAHVLGIALLVGGIVPLDLRLAGCWRRVPIAPLARVLVTTATTGFALAVASGALLFATRPLDYVVLPLFGLKLTLALAAAINALLVLRSPQWSAVSQGEASASPAGTPWRIAAGLSIVLWLSVVTAGRLIGYR